MKLKTRLIYNTPVCGIQINRRSGCIHYHSDLDIVAIKFKCCSLYYSCYWCHGEVQHAVQQWQPNEFNEKAILCGNCGSQMGIYEYLSCKNKCPYCASAFNSGCKSHWNYYFQINQNSC